MKKKTTRRAPAKKTTTRQKKSSRKSSVYIPAYKAIILCLSVIAICVVLLLVSTISGKTESEPGQEVLSSIAERFEPKPEEVAPAEPPKTETKKAEPKKEEPKKQEKTEAPKTEAPKKEPAKPDKTEKTEKTEKAVSFGFEKAKNGAQLCFVFDDGGQNLDQLKKFLELPFPITVAVLPQITHSVEAAQLVRKSGNEVILHQPMQSINNSINPGPGAITPDMTDDQIIAQLFINMEQISPIAGMNNHEGSGITADAQKMEIILQTVSEYGIYFLDSRTNVETTVPYVAGELGYSYYERNIFLDNEKTRENALAELKKGLAIANKSGSVIMIGHIWSADFLPLLLQQAYPELVEKGYTFSVVSTSKARKN
ncbi:MAG: divergent polysaccharide deacetylase family protein [Treponema sp.]|nr:divergent polysaccharide deacetylase family protein [Treponema sp.]